MDKTFRKEAEGSATFIRSQPAHNITFTYNRTGEGSTESNGQIINARSSSRSRSRSKSRGIETTKEIMKSMGSMNESSPDLRNVQSIHSIRFSPEKRQLVIPQEGNTPILPLERNPTASQQLRESQGDSLQYSDNQSGIRPVSKLSYREAEGKRSQTTAKKKYIGRTPDQSRLQ